MTLNVTLINHNLKCTKKQKIHKKEKKATCE